MKNLVVAYLADWGANSLVADDAKKLDIMNYAFAGIEDGKISDRELYNIDKVLEFRKNNLDMKLCVSVGGWGADGFSQAAATEEGREKFANSAVDLIIKYNLDGIDIDWEYPGSAIAGIASSPNDKVNFTLLLKATRKALTDLGKQNKKSYLLTIAVGAFQKAANDIEVKSIAEIIDYCYLMTYDFASGKELARQRYHTNLFSEPNVAKTSVNSAVEIYKSAGMPIGQIFIGAAFYGYWLADVKIENGNFEITSENPKNGTYTYTDIDKNKTAEQGYKYTWDNIAKAPWLYNGNIYITYDNKESVNLKCKYAKDNLLAGIMFWEYSQDKTGTLLDTMYKEMNM